MSSPIPNLSVAVDMGFSNWPFATCNIFKVRGRMLSAASLLAVVAFFPRWVLIWLCREFLKNVTGLLLVRFPGSFPYRIWMFGVRLQFWLNLWLHIIFLVKWGVWVFRIASLVGSLLIFTNSDVSAFKLLSHSKNTILPNTGRTCVSSEIFRGMILVIILVDGC